MHKSPELEFSHIREMPRYSAAMRTALTISAIVVTLLPVPVAYFRILPSYQVQAIFLLFYTPFFCLLTLCYLFYVRDSLARAMFADVLDPPPPPDPYYQEQFGKRLSRAFRRLKAILLGVLPVLLVIASMYCISRYLEAMNRSVALASATYAESAERQRVATAEAQGVKPAPLRAGRAGRARASRSPPPVAARVDSMPSPADTVAVRKYVLRTAEIDEIPRLAELTVFYMGAFVALLAAVSLMALKEYAKEALGLSEHELMFGRYRRAGVEE